MLVFSHKLHIWTYDKIFLVTAPLFRDPLPPFLLPRGGGARSTPKFTTLSLLTNAMSDCNSLLP